jgi:hypothetical protein
MMNSNAELLSQTVSPTFRICGAKPSVGLFKTLGIQPPNRSGGSVSFGRYVLSCTIVYADSGTVSCEHIYLVAAFFLEHILFKTVRKAVSKTKPPRTMGVVHFPG